MCLEYLQCSELSNDWLTDPSTHGSQKKEQKSSQLIKQIYKQCSVW